MDVKLSLIVLLSFLTWTSEAQSKSELREAKRLHRPIELSDGQLKNLATKTTDMDHFDVVLNDILIPRVVGTPEHKKVANFIAGELENLGWSVERDTFTDNTPIFGVLEFENIIGFLNPKADRFLVLACHYDSKYVREHDFVGATDSAVPCSMMLNLAKTMKEYLQQAKSSTDLSLALLFLDGEEAFKQWGPTDSIYGARHLAAKWENQLTTLKSGTVAQQLEKIDVFVLLDLIGTPNPKFYSYFPETKRWYNLLVDAEERLAEMGALRDYDSQYFSTISLGAHIEDDHIPFLKRGCPILHIIPTPFPSVWHKASDNRRALHMPTIENLNKILRVFVAQYLHLNI